MVCVWQGASKVETYNKTVIVDIISRAKQQSIEKNKPQES